MSLPRIIVTRRLPETVEARLRASFATELNVQDRPFDRAQLATALREADDSSAPSATSLTRRSSAPPTAGPASSRISGWA